MIQRRDFLRMLTAAGATLSTPLSLCASAPEPIVIETPFHGAILNHRNGAQNAEGLTIQVRGRAPLNVPVTVNGNAARRAGNRFIADLTLTQSETDIVATCSDIGGRSKHQIRVVWDRYSQPRYRFSIDDNSFFLRDIAQKKYKSLFDCFYLQLLKKLHNQYRTKFVLNIYYTTDDGFSLPQFPDRYREEWKDNSDWLKLAFHAWADKPDRPYQYAAPTKLISDLEKVRAEIIRFAGAETYSPPTVIHWGMVQPAALKPLADHGVRTLSGYFRKRGGIWDVNYFLDEVRSEYLSRHDALKDFDTGIVFSHIDIICNNTPAARIASTLEPLAADPNTAEVMDLFTHEQYFWPFYPRYIPDHAQRIETAIRWVTEHGYRPVFFHEGLLGGKV